ncbi:HlyU family transcriptional regulator [Microvirga roseola]|uniref:HlyU family transcriptional regulator n=1 Tax=Microvirga roseola TaxID=2883126 RepID=UPI001E63D1DB|nr:HlyU family transcriptional regulator [Microvirga roseola]
MSSIFKSLWSRLTNSGEARVAAEPAAEAVEYKGFRIRPAPYPSRGQYQTAGVIEKDFEGSVKEHRFVRAETHASKDAAAAFAVAKGRQIIDEQGDRMFG